MGSTRVAGQEQRSASLHRRQRTDSAVLPRVCRPHQLRIRTHSLIGASRSPSVSAEDVQSPTAALDLHQLFAEAQRNMVHINEERVAALQELDAAYDRITELEEELESTRQLAERATPVSAERDTAPASATQAPAQQPPEAAQNGAAVAPTITLAYETGWHEVYMHHCVEGKEWTQPPGLRFKDGTAALAGKRVVTVPAGSLEFVLTNGEGSWDTPGLGAGSKNYRISEPGTWVLRHGSLSRARM